MLVVMRINPVFIMNNFYRISLYILSFSLSSIILFSFTPINNFDKKELLGIIVSISSIIVAIIVTYLFSKLFSEKTIRVERKKEIDEFSKKITYLRRMAFHIKGMHNFWRYKNVNLKAIIDQKYPDLIYEEYRGYEVNGIKKFTYEELSKINDDIYGTDGQAYLALKALEDNEDTLAFYEEFNPKNYSLEDIGRYYEYANSFWYFLDRSERETYDFQRVHRYTLNFIDELYIKITGTQINQGNYRESLKNLFTLFEAEIFKKHFYLTKLNSNTFPRSFQISFVNMLVFLLLLILSLFFFTISLENISAYKSTLFLISLFVSNALDLIAITYLSLKSELVVNDVFKI